MPILGIIQWVGYFHVSSALLGELTIMSDCYDLYSKVSGVTIPMYLRSFGSNISRVRFKKVLFSDVSFKMYFGNLNVS